VRGELWSKFSVKLDKIKQKITPYGDCAAGIFLAALIISGCA
jgi:hypothetical protein